jgi:hypothetical protein
MALHRYKKFIWISCFLVVITALIYYHYTKATIKAAQPILGRDYRHLSLHPNGQEILFTECSDSLSTGCGIFRYSLKTQHLEHYNLPEGYAYLEASFSPQGNYVVMHRMPLPESEEDKEKVRAVQQVAEIAIMKVNGQAFQVLPLSPGPKTGPIMSNGEDKIAYLTMTPRKPGSKTLFANFNVWEFDLNSLTYQLFARDFRFFDIGTMQYMPDDQAILIEGVLPSSDHRDAGLSVTEYFKRYNGSSIYLLQRGEKVLSKPMFTEVKNAGHPSIDHQENIYFRGEAEQWRFFKARDNKIVQRWEGKWPFINTESLVASPNGNSLFVIYDLPDHDSRRGKYSRSIGKLDLISHTQQDVIIPPFNTAQVINVTPIK